MINGGEGSLQALIEYLVKALVDEPEQVSVSEVPGAEATTYEVRVAPNDLGKVIGKQGRIANALRTVAKASAMKQKRKVYVEIVA
ncbi:MAG TPA: KH domain-containing protein [Chthonomonadales bacterium]|nr:KH domain-containing protein [Chthonomonadales bacterium]